eukprot:6176978-Karenia_brevis.AAC.1
MVLFMVTDGRGHGHSIVIVVVVIDDDRQSSYEGSSMIFIQTVTSCIHADCIISRVGMEENTGRIHPRSLLIE